MPIIVGGTGLYFKALTEGLANVPKPAEGAFSDAQALLDDSGIEALRAEAERLDPVASQRVLGHDPQRLLRIVSVAKGTEKILSQWQLKTRPMIPKGFWKGVIIIPDRQKLYARINQRFDLMLELGALEEVQLIKERNVLTSLPVMKAVGVPSLRAFLEGKLSREEAIMQAKRDTRRFAKRQFTWFRGHSEGWTCVEALSGGNLF